MLWIPLSIARSGLAALHPITLLLVAAYWLMFPGVIWMQSTWPGLYVKRRRIIALVLRVFLYACHQASQVVGAVDRWTLPTPAPSSSTGT